MLWLLKGAVDMCGAVEHLTWCGVYTGSGPASLSMSGSQVTGKGPQGLCGLGAWSPLITGPTFALPSSEPPPAVCQQSVGNPSKQSAQNGRSEGCGFLCFFLLL